VREKSRVSFLPALRSMDSLLDQPSSCMGLLFDFFLEVEDWESEDCALANAPKDMEAVGAELSFSDSDCDSFWTGVNSLL